MCLVDDRVSEADSGDRLQERYGLLLQIPVRVDKYCDMVIVAQADEVGRYGFSLVVHNRSAEHITLLMQCVYACRTADCYPFNLYALVLVEPDRILVQVGECFLGVISEFLKPLGEDPSNAAVYDLVYFKIGVNLLAYRVDRRQPDSLDSLRHLLAVQDVCEDRILFKAVGTAEGLLGVAVVLCQPLVKGITVAFAGHGSDFVCIESATDFLFLALVLQYLSVNSLVVELSTGSQLDFLVRSALAFCLVDIACDDFIFGLYRYQNIAQMPFGFTPNFIERHRRYQAAF